MFKLSVYDLYADPLDWQRTLERRIRWFWRESSLPYALLILVICASITYLWWAVSRQDLNSLWPEFGGLTLDVLFILVIFTLFEGRRERLQAIERQREVIDDYKRWDNPEAHFRLAGAFRRLNKLGVRSVNLAGSRLSDFAFAKHGISSIEGSTFFDGQWGMRIGDNTVTLRRVSFRQINCRSVLFSPYDPLGGLSDLIPRHAQFFDCDFEGADLTEAIFDGASLTWEDAPPETHYSLIEEEGQVESLRETYGPFFETNLQGSSFRACLFKNADFRDAEGILEADFAGAQGLESALFDDNETREAVLKSARNEKIAKADEFVGVQAAPGQ